jgi:PadR family transcriptional regulator PadR
VGDSKSEVLMGTLDMLYPALLRLEQKGWIVSRWGASEKNRRARFYSLTAAGRRALAREAKDWRRMAAFIARVLEGAEGT